MGIRFFLLQISQKQQQNHQLRFLIAVLDAKKTVETVSEFRCPANFVTRNLQFLLRQKWWMQSVGVEKEATHWYLDDESPQDTAGS